MTIGIMQPYLYPYIGYFQLINAVDKFVILDDVNYINKGRVNRNVLPSGKFTIPLINATQNRLIRDIEMVKGGGVEFMERLQREYSKSDYYNIVIRSVVNVWGDKITTACYASMIAVSAYLGIQTEIIETSSSIPHEGKAQDRILSICHALGADRYINPEGGVGLYDVDLFRRNGVELKFLKSSGSKFSIIDTLMNYSPEEIKEMLNDYELF